VVYALAHTADSQPYAGSSQLRHGQHGGTSGTAAHPARRHIRLAGAVTSRWHTSVAVDTAAATDATVTTAGRRWSVVMQT